MRVFLKNGFSSVLEQIVSVVVSIVLTPQLVGMLGGAGYGLWKLLERAFNLVQSLDGRPGQYLQFKYPALKKEDPRRIEIFSSSIGIFLAHVVVTLVVTGLLLLLMIEMGMVGEEYTQNFWIVVLVIWLSRVLLTLASLFSSVLIGEKKSYYRVAPVAVNAVFLVALIYIISENDGVLLDVAYVYLVTSMLFCFMLYVKAAQFINFRMVLCDIRNNVSNNYANNLRYTLWGFLNKAILSLDVLLIGYVLGVEYVTSYTITLFVPLAVINLMVMFVGNIAPFLTGELGSDDYKAARDIRMVTFSIMFVLLSAVLPVLMMFNELYVVWWVGGGNYLGNWVTFLSLILLIATVYMRVESIVVDSTLDLDLKIKAAFLMLVLSAPVMVMIVEYYNISGLMFAVIMVRLALHAVMTVTVKKGFLYDRKVMDMRGVLQMGFLILYSMIAYYVVDFMQHSSVFNYIFLTLLMVVLFVYVSYRFLVGNRERELINDGVKIAIGR